MCFQSCLTSDALNWVQSEPPNELRISRRERAASERAKIARILRTKRSTACACSAAYWLARPVRIGRHSSSRETHPQDTAFLYTNRLAVLGGLVLTFRLLMAPTTHHSADLDTPALFAQDETTTCWHFRRFPTATQDERVFE